jgi:hypothetical protein
MTIWGIVAMLVVFIAIGAALFVQGMRQERRVPADDGNGSSADTEPEGRGMRAAMRRYVGPVSPELALLNPPARVGLEFLAALCGFPGLGWMMSTRVSIGLPMLIAGPAIVFGFYPAYLALSGHFTDRPLIALEYLPALAVISATALAVAEVRRLRAVRDAH